MYSKNLKNRCKGTKINNLIVTISTKMSMSISIKEGKKRQVKCGSMGDPVSQSNPDTAPPLRPEDAASASPEASDPAIQNDPTKSAAGGLIPFRLLRAHFASLLDLTNSAQKKIVRRFFKGQAMF